MASKCRKFEPNIFNKLKCQSCFGAKEIHSAEALENNKASRKISKCGYLFVAPDLDFGSPVDRTRRWQRRLFRLYDDGELTFCVDEDPDTVPQGCLDMNKCTEVKDAENTTSHPFSLAITVPGKKTLYIKGNSKEEIMWWRDVLSVFPMNLTKPKNRRFTMPIFSTVNKENVQPDNLERKSVSSINDFEVPSSKGRFEVEKVKPKEGSFSTYRGVRNMKHNKTDKHYQEGLRKSSSLHDLSSKEEEVLGRGLAASQYLSRSGDRINFVSSSSGGVDPARILADANYNNPYFTIPRRTWQTLAGNVSSPSPASSTSSLSSSTHSSSQQAVSPSPPSSALPANRRGSFDSKNSSTSRPSKGSERAQLHRERSRSLKDFPSQLSLPKADVPARKSLSSLNRLSSSSSRSEQSMSVDSGSEQNETDELKMAKSSELQQAASRSHSQPVMTSVNPQNPQSMAGTKYEDLMYMKKGWLIKQGTSEKDWKKHWFVLTGNSLRYYKDAKAEENNALDGRIDLSGCYDISEVNIGRNYGFRVKTRNGEYLLSAMTSGIRNNWMKAIRLVMDLQTSGGSKRNSNVSESDSSLSPRTGEEIDSSVLNSSNASSVLEEVSLQKEVSPKVEQKKAAIKPTRRHNSDVNPGNVSKMLKIKDIVGSLERIDIPPATVGMVTVEMGEAKKRDDVVDSAPDQESLISADGMPVGRYVEGSDDVQYRRPIISESKKEEERKRRGKSPSARVKEKSRAKSPKLMSPPPDSDDNYGYQMSIPSVDKFQHDEGRLSASSGDELTDHDHLSQDVYQEGHLHVPEDQDNLLSTASSAGGDGMLVELLETEVDSLKDQLEQSQQELVKMHESNRDLKTKLQTVVREKDLAQPQHGLESPIMRSLWKQQNVNTEIQENNNSSSNDNEETTTLRRQLKEARDTIQKQRNDADTLRSKLDMSVSKLSGTEKALSEALKDLKLEKDKTMKISNDWNKKVRNLEGQIRDVNVKLERQKDGLNMKDKECRRLEIDLKTNLQKIREHEREILKLKAVEHEYKQTKEKMDELERKHGSLREEIKERDKKYKKMEQEYSSQIADMEQEFSQERDALDQHIEELKKKLLENQQTSSVSDAIPNNIADILKDKDEIISQLEEKLIESDKRMLEMTDDLQAEADENATLQDSVKALNFDRRNNEKKMKEVEKLQSQLNTQKQSMENENSKMKSKLEELKKEKKEFGTKLEAEKLSALRLMKEKEELQKTINKLKTEMKLSPPSPQKSVSQDSQHSVRSVDDERYKEMIQNFIVVDSEMSDISGSLGHLRKMFNEYLSSAKTQNPEQSPSRLENIMDTMEEINQKCVNLQDILKEGRKELDMDAGEGGEFKTKYENAAAELDNLQKEVTETRNNCKKLQNSEKILQEKVIEYENGYKKQVALLSSRLDNLSEKVEKSKTVKTVPGKQDQTKTTVLSEKIEDELKELEQTIDNVEKLLDSQNSMSSKHLSDEVDDETEEEESDDGFTSSDDDEEEESEDDEINSADVSKDSRDFMVKLQQMKDQLEKTNMKMKDITSDLGSLNESSDSEMKQSLCKYSDKINNLSSRLSEKVTSAKSGGASFDGNGNDNAVVFQQCVQHLRQKLSEMGHLVDENESLDAKGLKSVKQKVGELSEYLGQLHKLEHKDFDLMGKIAKQEARSQALLYEKGRCIRRSRLSYDEKLSIYADRLAVESIVLGQMAYMVQERQMVNLYRDVLMREIKEVNAMILDLAKCIDDATREAGFHNGDLDVVSSYAALLAEKIVLEGQLASCTMAAESHNTDDTAILTSLQISDNPSILAMEVFLRSQLDSSINQQIQEHSSSSSHSDTATGHIVTRSLVQGELTHALQKLKSQFNTQVGMEDIVELLKRERQFSHDQLLVREESICNSVDMFHSVCLSCLRYHIQKTQAHVPQLVDTLCQKVTEHFHSKIEEYQEKLNVLEGSERRKKEFICEMLQSELSLASSTLQQLNELSQPELGDEEHFDLNIHSAEATVIQMCDILIQRAVVCGSVAHVKELFRTGHPPQVSDIVSSTSDPVSDVVAKNLSQMLESEAANKQSLSAELKLHGKERTEDSDYLNRMVDLIGVVPDMGDFSPENLTVYAQHLVREALFQSQLTYTTYKLKLQHEHDMRDLKIRIEAGQKVELPSETCKDTESDIQASLSVFEEILETKFEDECEVLSILDKEIKQLKLANANKSTVDSETFEKQLQTLANTFEHELSVVQERHDIHLDVLRQEISNICIRLEKVSEDHDKEKETLSSEYEERIITLQDEMECIRGDHEEELEQVRQDIMTAVSAIRANDETSDDQLSDQVKLLNNQLATQVDNSIKMLEEIQKLPEFEKNPSLVQTLKEYIRKIRLTHPDPEQQTMPLSPKPVPVFTLQEDEEETTSAVTDTSIGEPSESASSQQLDISHHEQELELLKKEKEEALAEEVKTTKAALDAMRKAYEEDLEIEKDRYREALKTMYTDDYFQEIRHRYETEANRLNEELKQTTMHYDSKCEDYKLLEDKIDRMKTDYDAHIAQLVKSNEQLNSLVNEEIGKLKEFIQNRTMATVPGNATIEEELYDAQINVRVKDAELQKLRGQVKNLENNLERTTEEQRHSMTQYYQLHKKYTDLQAQLKQSLESKQEKEIQARDARSLRRTPSFHHRARSPSPQLASSSKGDKEHHSRESNRRSSRHLDARDLKRSKSSPSIPYIMDRRLSGKNTGLKSAKVPKSQKP